MILNFHIYTQTYKLCSAVDFGKWVDTWCCSSCFVNFFCMCQYTSSAVMCDQPISCLHVVPRSTIFRQSQKRKSWLTRPTKKINQKSTESDKVLNVLKRRKNNKKQNLFVVKNKTEKRSSQSWPSLTAITIRQAARASATATMQASRVRAARAAERATGKVILAVIMVARRSRRRSRCYLEAPGYYKTTPINY